MRSVNLKVFKNRLSEYVRIVAGGETVLVIDRNRVVVELVPPQPGRASVPADAVWEGGLTPDVRVGCGPPPRKPVAASRDLMDALHRDRNGR
jgi:antitoxin (DNA-binding transcriptional repressor) of toxin-antitoxin stability system